MFGNLVESSSHKGDYARRGSFFLGTLSVYALAFLAIGVGSIYAYNTHVENQDLRVVSMLAPAETPEAQTPQTRSAPKQSAGGNNDSKVAVFKTQPVITTTDPRLVPKGVSVSMPVPELPQWSSFPCFEGLIEYSHALGRAHTGDLEGARKAIDRMRQLRDSSTDPRLDYFKRQLDQQIQAASACVTYSEGNKDEAVNLLRRAADAEDMLGKHPVSPGALVPAREQLGDLLLTLKRPKEAQREFEAALKIYPGRFRGLYGAAQAAEQIGEKEKAAHYYAKLIEQTTKADGSRSELAQLREYRTADGATTQPRSATEPRQ